MSSFYKYSLSITCILLFAITVHAQDYQWHCTLSMPTYAVAFNPLSHGRVLFTSTPEGQYILRSDDGGETWHASNPLDVPTPEIHQIYCLPSDTNIVLALSSGEFHANPELYRSTDGGMNWTATQDLGGIDGEAIAYYPLTDELYYGENFAGIVFKSTDHGKTWTVSGTQDSKVTLCSLGVSPDSNKVLLAGSESGVIDRSTNQGTTWNIVYSADTVKNPEVPKVIFSDVATNVAFVTRWHSLDASLVMTRDRGITWSPIPSPDPHVWAVEIDQRKSMCPNGTPMHLWTGLFLQNVKDTTAGGLIEESNDGGISWHATGFPRIPIPPNVWIIKYDTTSGTLAAATDSGIFIGHEPKVSVGKVPIDVPGVTLYPNPASRGEVVIEILSSESVNSSVNIYDVLGREVGSRSVKRDSNKQTLLLQTKEFVSGIYYARITTDGSAQTRKFVIAP